MPSLQTTQLAWLRKYAKANPLLALWSLMLFCGGSVLLSYHADLAYLPDFNLVDLAGLMASVTLIGLLLVVFFLFSCFVPGLTLRWVEHQWPLIPYRRYFDFNEMLVLWISSIAIWVVYVLYSTYLPIPVFIPPALKPYVLLPTIALAAVIVAILACRRTTAKFSLKFWNYRLITRRIVAFPIWVGLFSFPLLAALKFASSGDSAHEIPLAIGAVALLTIFNGVVYAAPLSEIRESISIHGIVGLAVIPLGLGLAIVFPQTVMQSLALGHRNAVTLTVTGENCYSLARFQVPCTPKENTDGAIELENVNVLSRVGTTVLLELLIQETTGSSGAAPQPVIAGTMNLAQERRRPYCPSTSANSAATCSACNARLLQRANIPGSSDTDTLERYRRDLVCVQLTIPKSDITNIAFGAKRQYSGYSSFSLPGRFTVPATAPAVN